MVIVMAVGDVVRMSLIWVSCRQKTKQVTPQISECCLLACGFDSGYKGIYWKHFRDPSPWVQWRSGHWSHRCSDRWADRCGQQNHPSLEMWCVRIWRWSPRGQSCPYALWLCAGMVWNTKYRNMIYEPFWHHLWNYIYDYHRKLLWLDPHFCVIKILYITLMTVGSLSDSCLMPTYNILWLYY